MKRLLPILLVLCVALLRISPAQSAAEPISDLAAANKLLDEANTAYELGDARKAMDLYVRIAQAGYGTAPVWSNAGAAAYRSGEIGYAVLYYSRALRADAGYDRARASLAYISPATNDHDGGFLGVVVESVFQKTSPGFWVILAEVFLLGASLGLARVLAIADRDRRGVWYAVLGWSLVFCVATSAAAYANHRYRAGGDDAVVILDKAVTRSEPKEDSTAQLELPAGTILRMTEEPRRGFVRFKLADGRTGYIQTDQVERI